MKGPRPFYNLFAALALALLAGWVLPGQLAHAQDIDDAELPQAKPDAPRDQALIDALLDRLANAPDAGEAGRIESLIDIEMAKSGSAAIDFLHGRGRDALEQGNTTAAIDHFSAALDHDPGFIEARALRAIAWHQAGETGPALEDAAQVLQVMPRHQVSLALLAVILEETDQRQRALDAWRRVAEINPWMDEAKAAVTRLERALQGQAS